MLRIFKNLEDYYYKNGFDGGVYLFREYLCRLRDQKNLMDITILANHGKSGLSVLESSISTADGFLAVKQKFSRMYTTLKGFSGESGIKSVWARYGENADFRDGVSDNAVEFIDFSNGVYSCIVVAESTRRIKEHVFSKAEIQLMKSFIYQKQLQDFHKIGYSYNGYMGIPSRDELKKHLKTYIGQGENIVLVGVRVVNMSVLEEKKYSRAGVYESMANYFLPYYRCGVFTINEETVGIIAEANSMGDCVEEFEEHILMLNKMYPEMCLSVCISTLATDTLSVLYDVEYALEERDYESFRVLRTHKEFNVQDEDVERMKEVPAESRKDEFHEEATEELKENESFGMEPGDEGIPPLEYYDEMAEAYIDDEKLPF